MRRKGIFVYFIYFIFNLSSVKSGTKWSKMFILRKDSTVIDLLRKRLSLPIIKELYTEIFFIFQFDTLYRACTFRLWTKILPIFALKCSFMIGRLELFDEVDIYNKEHIIEFHFVKGYLRKI